MENRVWKVKQLINIEYARTRQSDGEQKKKSKNFRNQF